MPIDPQAQPSAGGGLAPPNLGFAQLLKQFWLDMYGKEVQSAATYSYMWLADQGGHIFLGLVIDFGATLLVGYVLLSTLGAAWPWALAVVACMFCSFFVQSGEGAVFAIVPLVKKRVGGQVAGMAGVYGNVGAVVVLTVGLFGSSQVFFLTIAASAVVACAGSVLLVEPADSFAAELLTDEDPARAPVAVAATAASGAADPLPTDAHPGVRRLGPVVS